MYAKGVGKAPTTGPEEILKHPRINHADAPHHCQRYAEHNRLKTCATFRFGPQKEHRRNPGYPRSSSAFGSGCARFGFRISLVLGCWSLVLLILCYAALTPLTIRAVLAVAQKPALRPVMIIHNWRPIPITNHRSPTAIPNVPPTKPSRARFDPNGQARKWPSVAGALPNGPAPKSNARCDAPNSRRSTSANSRGRYPGLQCAAAAAVLLR